VIDFIRGDFVKTLWIATSNEHKKEEFQEMLGDKIVIKTLKDLPNHIEIIENANTFEGNALIKARALYEAVGEPVIADDSGLEVNALGGAPGVLSARFMGEETPYTIKNQAIIDAVNGKDRTARFVCVIAFIDETGQEHLYRGVMEGEVNEKIEGEHGFGYDPIFYYPPFGTTNAMVSPELKNAHSHRGEALKQFLEEWKNHESYSAI
jgi:XTP/dITP diphosphohydrolase